MRERLLAFAASAVLGCHAGQLAPPTLEPPGQLTVRPIPLPGATKPVSLDYLAVDRRAGRVWIPAGGTGSVDVLDVSTDKLQRVEGFATAEREARGSRRVLGPSSATVGDGFVYVGNRANAAVCAVDARKLTLGTCLELPSSPDGLLYVAATQEVWVTTPRDRSIAVLDASIPAALALKSRVALNGEPEGYVYDETRGQFFTNLEDRNRTLAIDVRTKAVVSDWDAGCGASGPRGLAVDAAMGWLFVACTDGLNQLDLNHGGAKLARLETGEGVDNIDYLESRRLVFAAAGKAGRMTVARADAGRFSVVATAPLANGARSVVVDARGGAYAVDPAHGQVLGVSPPP